MEAKRRVVRITWVILALLATGTLVSCTEPLLDNRPYIVVSPDSGEPGTRIAVTGSRFPATTLLSVRHPSSKSTNATVYGTSGSNGRFGARWITVYE